MYLNHELGNDTVEGRALEVQGLAGGALALLTSAQGTEVLSSLGDNISEQFHGDASSGLATDGDIEIHTWARHDD